MGNAAAGHTAGAASSSKHDDDSTPPVVYPSAKHATSVEYFVRPYKAAPGVPEHLIFRLDPEAAVVLDASTGVVLKTWPYHLVLCWGYTETTFQLKAFLPGEKPVDEETAAPRVLIPTPSLRNIKVPEGSAEIEAVVMTTTQARSARTPIPPSCAAVCTCTLHTNLSTGPRDGEGNDGSRHCASQRNCKGRPPRRALCSAACDSG
jgi:hypothetical protein